MPHGKRVCFCFEVPGPGLTSKPDRINKRFKTVGEVGFFDGNLRPKIAFFYLRVRPLEDKMLKWENFLKQFEGMSGLSDGAVVVLFT